MGLETAHTTHRVLGNVTWMMSVISHVLGLYLKIEMVFTHREHYSPTKI